MYKFSLARTKVSASDDTTRMLGYNYYIEAYLDEKLMKQELIYTTVSKPNPINLLEHEPAAKAIYQDFIADKRTNTHSQSTTTSSRPQPTSLIF